MTFADTVTLTAVRDNTLYEDAQGDVSNALGPDIFAGVTDQPGKRRALIWFDFSAVPPGSTVSSVSVNLTLNRARTGTTSIGFYRALADWGEGTSIATNQEGRGAVATSGDATWLHRFYPSVTWATQGGDFAAAASATASVGTQNTTYTWTGAGLASDVAGWVNAPATNFGWLVKAVDETQGFTARRFFSGEAASAVDRPTITVTYTPPVSPTGACCAANGTCYIVTAFDCGLQGGTYQGNGSACVPNPCPQPTGACCTAGAVCTVVTQAQCDALGGLYQGNFTTCTPNPCTPTTTVNFVATIDNTMFESVTGALSNGSGQGFFAGASDNPVLRRRALLAFNVTGLPSNAIITEVELRLFLGYTQATASHTVSLHRALASWGEGTSDANGNETAGANSTTGDATWIHRLYNTTLWSVPGGEFTAGASASTLVGITTGQTYEWSGAGLVADVQGWLGSPATNFGWAVIGNEAVARSQRRFDSSESATPANRPTLSVTYTLPSSTGACCLTDGSCSVLTAAQCANAGGSYSGDGTVCSPNPCPQPTGACCLNNASCVTVTQTQCASQGGSYLGNGTLCANANCPLILEPFVDAMPIPPVAQPVTGQVGGAAHYEMAAMEFMHQVHRDLPPTRVWGYEASWPGPTIVARQGMPVTVTWMNELRDIDTGLYRTSHVLPVDTCLHGPDVMTNFASIVTHLHGGAVTQESDGYPEFYFPPGQQAPLYHYPNTQPASLIWYHDHALGITRLNVYMGLAGGYLLRDSTEESLGLPAGDQEVPLVIQDRSFSPDGSLMYHDMWHDHFFGDFMVVNGKVMPYMNVKQGKYRFRVVEGCNSRTLTLALSNGASFQIIGSDTGLLEAPITVTSITLTPGERSDWIVDFSGYPAGTEIVLTNSAPSPFPGTPGVGVLPNVMKFIVQGQAGSNPTIPSSLVDIDFMLEADAVIERTQELRKMPDIHCPSHTDGMWTIDGLTWEEITERPRVGDIEVWAWRNRSGIIHPMHMHLVAFQVLDRQAFDSATGLPIGPVFPPNPEERGWKDTVQATPGQITRVITRFEGTPGIFPYHCHILEHEDHEMMRQFELIPRCGSADFDGDGDIGTDLDIEAFFACLGGNCCATCGSADFDGDGDTGTDLDIEAFFRVLGGGDC